MKGVLVEPQRYFRERELKMEADFLKPRVSCFPLSVIHKTPCFDFRLPREAEGIRFDSAFFSDIFWRNPHYAGFRICFLFQIYLGVRCVMNYCSFKDYFSQNFTGGIRCFNSTIGVKENVLAYIYVTFLMFTPFLPEHLLWMYSWFAIHV